jgi:hypothetical protein
VLKWLFGRGGRDVPREPDVPPGDAAPDVPLGPDPPLPQTKNRPGVTVHAATAVAAEALTAVRPAVSRLGPLGEGPSDGNLGWAAVVLSGESPGDVLVSPDGAFALPPGTLALLDGAAEGKGAASLLVGRDALTGVGIPGIAGARVLARTGGRTILRLGPPPAARWAVIGLRSVAVLVGKLTLFDGEESHDVRAGQAALVADPTATLYLQAGNDTAVAIGFAAPDLLVRLG